MGKVVENQINERLNNHVGMFDFAKGIGMILVVLAHTITQYKIDSLPFLITIFYKLFFNGIIPMFFISSGYGFRKQRIGKCFVQQARLILCPYCYVTLGIAIIFPCIHYAFFKWPRGALVEMMREVLAFILGVSSSESGIKIGPYELYNCGPVWFLLTLMNSWIILNIIFQMKNEYLRVVFVLFLVIIGLVLCSFGIWFFCFQASLIATGYLYVGYILKKKSLLQKKLPFWIYILLVIGWYLQVNFGEVRMNDNYWKLGFLDMIMSVCSGLLLLKFALLCNRFKGMFSQGIRIIGRYSLWIMCVHTVESLCIPWYLFPDNFKSNPLVGFFIQFLLHGVIIFSGCYLIKKYIYLKNQIKKRWGVL